MRVHLKVIVRGLERRRGFKPLSFAWKAMALVVDLSPHKSALGLTEWLRCCPSHCLAKGSVTSPRGNPTFSRVGRSAIERDAGKLTLLAFAGRALVDGFLGCFFRCHVIPLVVTQHI
jgi:hypothetical protein